MLFSVKTIAFLFATAFGSQVQSVAAVCASGQMGAFGYAASPRIILTRSCSSISAVGSEFVRSPQSLMFQLAYVSIYSSSRSSPAQIARLTSTRASSCPTTAASSRKMVTPKTRIRCAAAGITMALLSLAPITSTYFYRMPSWYCLT